MRYPRVLRKLKTEIMEFSSRSTPLDRTELRSMRYLQNVLRESKSCHILRVVLPRIDETGSSPTLPSSPGQLQNGHQGHHTSDRRRSGWKIASAHTEWQRRRFQRLLHAQAAGPLRHGRRDIPAGKVGQVSANAERQGKCRVGLSSVQRRPAGVSWV